MTLNAAQQDWVDVHLAMGERRTGSPYDYEKCRWCAHEWHGMPCTCFCESALTSRDSTWRPFTGVTEAHRIMHTTGVDGWVARVAAGKCTVRKALGLTS